ncbi:hypothetical protein NTCA1_18120 [Novosphingobium sp. TCA1]|nr:hypothetical protein NTCA1_18120 [Novosphingobium sp. TCA1]
MVQLGAASSQSIISGESGASHSGLRVTVIEKSVHPKAFHTSASTPTIQICRGVRAPKVPAIASLPVSIMAPQNTPAPEAMQFPEQ